MCVCMCAACGKHTYRKEQLVPMSKQRCCVTHTSEHMSPSPLCASKSSRKVHLLCCSCATMADMWRNGCAPHARLSRATACLSMPTCCACCSNARVCAVCLPAAILNTHHHHCCRQPETKPETRPQLSLKRATPRLLKRPRRRHLGAAAPFAPRQLHCPPCAPAAAAAVSGPPSCCQRLPAPSPTAAHRHRQTGSEVVWIWSSQVCLLAHPLHALLHHAAGCVCVWVKQACLRRTWMT